jgi:hypothetical protein
MKRSTAIRKDRKLSRSAARTMRDYAVINHTIRPHSEYPYDPAFARKVDLIDGSGGQKQRVEVGLCVN